MERKYSNIEDCHVGVEIAPKMAEERKNDYSTILLELAKTVTDNVNLIRDLESFLVLNTSPVEALSDKVHPSDIQDTCHEYLLWEQIRRHTDRLRTVNKTLAEVVEELNTFLGQGIKIF